MNRKSMQLVIVCLLVFQSAAFAQSEDMPKYEIAARTTQNFQFIGGVGFRF